MSHSLRDWIHYRSSPFTGPGDPTAPASEWARTNGRYHVHQLPGYELELDLADPGISSELFTRGIREPVSYWAYRNVMRELPDDPLVLEIGSNIGYYALAAVAECPDATVLCADIDASNIDRLRTNAERNDMSNNIQAVHRAIADDDGEVSIDITAESNCHAVDADGEETVPSWSVDTWLEESGYAPEDVDVVRMDVEGYEGVICSGMPEEVCPAAVHLEYHPHAIDYGDLDGYPVLSFLKNQCPPMISAAVDDRQLPTPKTVGNIPRNKSVELVCGHWGVAR